MLVDALFPWSGSYRPLLARYPQSRVPSVAARTSCRPSRPPIPARCVRLARRPRLSRWAGVAFWPIGVLGFIHAPCLHDTTDIAGGSLSI